MSKENVELVAVATSAAVYGRTLEVVENDGTEARARDIASKAEFMLVLPPRYKIGQRIKFVAKT